jgi:hypothetical protein
VIEINVNRKLEPGMHRIPDAFPDLREDPMMVEIFGSIEAVNETLDTITLNLTDIPHYMNVNNDDGTINVGLGHLRNSEAEVLYLDILHELFHVYQLKEDVDLYPKGVAYADRTTEIEAYAFGVEVARRIGMTDKEILDYLWVEWISPDENKTLARRSGVDI